MNLLPTSVTAARALKGDPHSGAALIHQPVKVSDTVTMVLADNEGHYTGPGTNTYLVGRDRLWILDPGPLSTAHVDAVMAAADGRSVDGILVTHSQLDHSPAAKLLQDRTDAPVYGHSAIDRSLIGVTEEDIDPDFSPDIAVADGDVVADSGLQAVHTPGHYPNHLCFHYGAESLIFTGDHIMGWATTVVVPPLGCLPSYLDSLKRLETAGVSRFLPSHGPAIENPEERCRELREHRLARHTQIENCLEAGVTDVSAIVDTIYEALPERLITAAMGQVKAHLLCRDAVPALCSPPAK